MKGLRIAKGINALIVLCAFIAVIGIWLILFRMQANIPDDLTPRVAAIFGEADGDPERLSLDP